MSSVETRRTVRFLDVHAQDTAAARNGIEDLYEDRLDVILIRGAFDPSRSAALGRDLDRTDRNPGWATPNERMPVEDIQSWDGLPISQNPGDPLPTGATLSGLFSTNSLSLNSGANPTILFTFTNSILFNPTGLADGALAIIYATPVGDEGGGQVPEPASLMLLGSGVLSLVGMRKRRKASKVE